MKTENKIYGSIYSEDDVCWHSIPIEYDIYSRENSDKYEGDIFGRLSLFESPHYLFRRFHKNYCKAIALTRFRSYAFKKDAQDTFLNEIKESVGVNFSVKQLMMHNAIILLVCSLEIYLKDNFILIVNRIYPEKLNGKRPEEVARKFNFQNIESISKAYRFLIPNFDDSGFYQIPSPQTFTPYFDCKFIITDLLQLRHKIIHESFYDGGLRENEFNWFFYCCLCLVENFDFYFETKGFYKLEK